MLLLECGAFGEDFYLLVTVVIVVGRCWSLFDLVLLLQLVLDVLGGRYANGM